MTMIRAHKIRLNPTPEQEIYFRKAVGISRFVYNWGLGRWKQAKEQGLSEYGAMAIKKEFNSIKGEQFGWVYDVTKSATEYALLNLGKSLKNYFDSKTGKRNGKRVGFPKFKSKKAQKQSFGLANDRFKVDGHWLTIQKLPDAVNMAESLRFKGKIMGATISCKTNHWYISIQVEIPAPEPTDFPQESIGIDVGIKSLLVLSNGRTYENQVLLRSELKTLKRLNRRLARRKQGSGRWKRAKFALSRFHERIANRRNDYLHKITTEIAKTYRIIAIEDLNVKGMVKNRRLALSLSDASLGTIPRMLEYKSMANGGILGKVDRFFPSSRLCGVCGLINDSLTLNDREWDCIGCGTHHDRDWNAAQNIEREFLRNYYSAVATSS